MIPDLVNGPKLAQILGVTRAWVHRLTERGDIPAMRVATPRGVVFVYTKATVERLKKEGLVAPH